MQFCYNNTLIETELDNIRCVVNAKVNVVLLPDNQYDKHISDLSKMTMKQKKYWKALYKDTNGTLTQMRWIDGQIKNKNFGKWIRVIPAGCVDEEQFFCSLQNLKDKNYAGNHASTVRYRPKLPVPGT